MLKTMNCSGKHFTQASLFAYYLPVYAAVDVQMMHTQIFQYIINLIS